MSAPVVSPKIPPLRTGDQLTRDEFERRYDAMPGLKKAELLEGVVYVMPSPVNTEFHGQPRALINCWLAVYFARTPGLVISDNGSVRLDDENEPQPDVALMIARKPDGGAALDADGYVAGAPELVTEVSASTVSIDRNKKLRVYQSHGVREYVIWRTEDAEIDWFVLRGDRYEQLPVSPDGVIRSEVFPGLWLDSQALLRQDLARVLTVLQLGIADQSHADFVARLSGS